MKLRNRAMATQGLILLMAFQATQGAMALAMDSALAQTPVATQGEQTGAQNEAVAPQPGATQTNPSAAKSVVVTGTVARSGTGYILRVSTGNEYQLDPADKAEPFEGKAVKVTGMLETEAKLLHVETIEEVSA